MPIIGERELRNLAAAIIADAVRDIKRGKINICGGYRPDKDLKWLHDPGSSFPMWCEALDMDPDQFREMFPLSMANGFKFYVRTYRPGTSQREIVVKNK